MNSTTYRFIGDVHGKFRRYRDVIRDVPRSIQIGDMGVGFYKYNSDREIVPYANPPFDSMSKGDHKFIRGNHDNPKVCSEHPFWIKDGEYKNDIFFCGGAVSIDKAWRIKGLTWWEDEELSQEELNTIIDKYKEIKPKIVVTHDCPESVANEIMQGFNLRKLGFSSRSRQAFESMLYHHQPKLWIFGHWHHTLTFKRGDTVFKCLGELEYEDIDIDKV